MSLDCLTKLKYAEYEHSCLLSLFRKEYLILRLLVNFAVKLSVSWRMIYDFMCLKTQQVRN